MIESYDFDWDNVQILDRCRSPKSIRDAFCQEANLMASTKKI